jgi:hypothetical protein
MTRKRTGDIRHGHYCVESREGELFQCQLGLYMVDTILPVRGQASVGSGECRLRQRRRVTLMLEPGL